MDLNLSALNESNIDVKISNVNNWIGTDYISYQNLYLAELYNKLSALNTDIEIIKNIHNSQFDQFTKDITGYILNIFKENKFDYIYDINGLSGEHVTGLSAITINDITHCNKDNVDLGNFLTKKVVNAFNNITRLCIWNIEI